MSIDSLLVTPKPLILLAESRYENTDLTDPYMDVRILPMLHYLNNLDGVVTMFSCCGHGIEDSEIVLMLTKEGIESINDMLHDSQLLNDRIVYLKITTLYYPDRTIVARYNAMILCIRKDMLPNVYNRLNILSSKEMVEYMPIKDKLRYSPEVEYPTGTFLMLKSGGYYKRIDAGWEHITGKIVDNVSEDDVDYVKKPLTDAQRSLIVSFNNGGSL